MMTLSACSLHLSKKVKTRGLVGDAGLLLFFFFGHQLAAEVGNKW